MTARSDVGAHSLRPTDEAAPESVDQPVAPISPKQKPPRSLASTLGTLVLIVIAVVVVGAAALVYIYHPRFDTVLTGSMRPGIQPGDVVMVRAVPTDELKVGDVIAYLPPQHTVPVLHRIVSIDSSGLVTKGDANNVADPWGKVSTDSPTTLRLVWVIPKIGLIAHNRTTIYVGAGVLFLAAITLTVFTHKRRDANDEPSAGSDGAGAGGEGPGSGLGGGAPAGAQLPEGPEAEAAPAVTDAEAEAWSRGTVPVGRFEATSGRAAEVGIAGTGPGSAAPGEVASAGRFEAASGESARAERFGAASGGAA